MRAMILAAGEGKRMGELTQTIPKPLLPIGDQYLIDFAIQQVVNAGISDIIINISHHAAQIKKALGHGERYNANIIYSEERERLETGGGILKALPFLGKEKFLVLSADVISNFPLKTLLAKKMTHLAHLIMVANPNYHTGGDFGLHKGLLTRQKQPFYTFANIGIYHPDLFSKCEPGYFRLNKILCPAIDKQQITGEIFSGTWFNVGNQEDLKQVRAFFAKPKS